MQTITRMAPSHIKISATGIKAFIPVILFDGKSHSMGGQCGQNTHIDARKMAKDAIELIEAGAATLEDFQSGAIEPHIARKNGHPPQELWVLVNRETSNVCFFLNPVEGQEDDLYDYVFGYITEAAAREDIANLPNPHQKSVMHLNTLQLAQGCREWNAGFAVYYPDGMVFTFIP